MVQGRGMSHKRTAYLLAGIIGVCLIAVIALFWLFFVPHGDRAKEKIDDVRLRLVPKVHQVMKTYYEEHGEYPELTSTEGQESLNTVNLGDDAEHIILEHRESVDPCREAPMAKDKLCFVALRRTCSGDYSVTYWSTERELWVFEQVSYDYGSKDCSPSGETAPTTKAATETFGSGTYPDYN